MLKSKKSKDGAETVQSEPSLADLVAGAKASADLDSVLAGLAADIEAAKVSFAAAIERQRDLSIDPGAASDAVVRSERLVATLSLRRQEVARRRPMRFTDGGACFAHVYVAAVGLVVSTPEKAKVDDATRLQRRGCGAALA